MTMNLLGFRSKSCKKRNNGGLSTFLSQIRNGNAIGPINFVTFFICIVLQCIRLQKINDRFVLDFEDSVSNNLTIHMLTCSIFLSRFQYICLNSTVVHRCLLRFFFQSSRGIKKNRNKPLRVVGCACLCQSVHISWQLCPQNISFLQRGIYLHQRLFVARYK